MRRGVVEWIMLLLDGSGVAVVVVVVDSCVISDTPDVRTGRQEAVMCARCHSAYGM